MSTPARRRLPPHQRRAQLVDVGADVFIRLGYQGTSLEAIAADAGVTRPLLYRYVRDKDELYLEILRDARAELDEALVDAVADAVTDGGGPEEQLRAGMRAYFTFVRDRGERWDLLFGPGHAVAGPVAVEAARLRHETADKIAALVQAAAPALDGRSASAYAHAVSGAGAQLAAWWRHHPDVGLDEVVGLHLDVVWGGLRLQAEAAPTGRPSADPAQAG